MIVTNPPPPLFFGFRPYLMVLIYALLTTVGIAFLTGRFISPFWGVHTLLDINITTSYVNFTEEATTAKHPGRINYNTPLGLVVSTPSYLGADISDITISLTQDAMSHLEQSWRQAPNNRRAITADLSLLTNDLCSETLDVFISTDGKSAKVSLSPQNSNQKLNLGIKSPVKSITLQMKLVNSLISNGPCYLQISNSKILSEPAY
jgi:hypothetical protein